jgi:hypothetical protein
VSLSFSCLFFTFFSLGATNKRERERAREGKVGEEKNYKGKLTVESGEKSIGSFRDFASLSLTRALPLPKALFDFIFVLQ